MVDIVGHVGMALVWLSVGWAVYDGRAAPGFVALGLPFSLLPDVDLWVQAVVPAVKHHGVTHTIAFASVAALVVGAALARWVVPRLEGRFVPAAEIGSRYVYAVGAVWVAILSHLFADVLSAPDIAEPIEPFWPLYDRPIGLDVVYYADPIVNWGLFLAGLALTAALWRRGVGARSTVEA